MTAINKDVSAIGIAKDLQRRYRFSDQETKVLAQELDLLDGTSDGLVRTDRVSLENLAGVLDKFIAQKEGPATYGVKLFDRMEAIAGLVAEAETAPVKFPEEFPFEITATDRLYQDVTDEVDVLVDGFYARPQIQDSQRGDYYLAYGRVMPRYQYGREYGGSIASLTTPPNTPIKTEMPLAMAGVAVWDNDKIKRLWELLHDLNGLVHQYPSLRVAVEDLRSSSHFGLGEYRAFAWFGGLGGVLTPTQQTLEKISLTPNQLTTIEREIGRLEVMISNIKGYDRVYPDQLAALRIMSRDLKGISTDILRSRELMEIAELAKYRAQAVQAPQIVQALESSAGQVRSAANAVGMALPGPSGRVGRMALIAVGAFAAGLAIGAGVAWSVMEDGK